MPSLSIVQSGKGTYLIAAWSKLKTMLSGIYSRLVNVSISIEIVPSVSQNSSLKLLPFLPIQSSKLHTQSHVKVI